MNIMHTLKSIFKIARLESSDDIGDFQQGVFSYMGSTPRGQVFVQYGDLMRAPDGSQMAVFAQCGNESNQIGLASDPKRRTVKNLAQGERGMANYLTGSYLLFTEDGGKTIVVNGDWNIQVTGNVNLLASETVTVTAPNTVINGDVEINGELVNNGINLTTHNHSQGADNGGDVEQDTSGPQNP